MKDDDDKEATRESDNAILLLPTIVPDMPTLTRIRIAVADRVIHELRSNSHNIRAPSLASVGVEIISSAHEHTIGGGEGVRAEESTLTAAVAVTSPSTNAETAATVTSAAVADVSKECRRKVKGSCPEKNDAGEICGEILYHGRQIFCRHHQTKCYGVNREDDKPCDKSSVIDGLCYQCNTIFQRSNDYLEELKIMKDTSAAIAALQANAEEAHNVRFGLLFHHRRLIEQHKATKKGRKKHYRWEQRQLRPPPGLARMVDLTGEEVICLECEASQTETGESRRCCMECSGGRRHPGDGIIN